MKMNYLFLWPETAVNEHKTVSIILILLLHAAPYYITGNL